MNRTYSVEAEQSVLGGLLANNDTWHRAADLLTEADFYRHEHKLIFRAIGKLINSNKGADTITVFEALQEAKEADYGGLAYINAVAQSVPSANNVRRYAEIVRDRSILRGLLAKVDEAQTLAIGPGSTAEKLDAVAALFSGIDAGHSAKSPQPMSAVMVAVIDQINAAVDGLSPGWPTGIYALDSRLNGGLRPGKVYIIAARPGVGKTSLAGQILVKMAHDGRPGLMLSQEMPAEELGQRALANTARVNFGNIQTGKLSNEEWNRTAEGVDKLGPLNLWVDDEPGLNIRAINSKARSIKGLKVLALDYLQLSEGEGDTRSAQVGSISRALKKLAKQLGIAILCLSQLNREVDKRPGQRPQLSDLRDSGEIEQDADVILFLWPLEPDQGAELKHIGLEIAKNRQGKKGAFVMQFEGAMQSWRESTQSIESFGGIAKTRSNFE